MFREYYKFVLTSNRFSVLEKIVFISEHALIILVLFFIYKVLTNLEDAGLYLGICLFSLIPLITNARKSYQKFKIPFYEYLYKDREMTPQEKEALHMENQLINLVESGKKNLK